MSRIIIEIPTEYEDDLLNGDFVNALIRTVKASNIPGYDRELMRLLIEALEGGYIAD